jgi:hypothetical protein
MGTQPWWASAGLADRIDEPFRSDGTFWAGLDASADALLALLAAAVAGVVLALTGAGGWAALPFVVPAGLVVRATAISRAASRRNQAEFPDRRAWRDAERTAVAAVFLRVLSHRHRAETN